MQNNKITYGVIGGLIMILAAITAVSIVYASYMQTLNINGSATVEASSWKIKFINLGAVSLTGDATEITAPTLSDTLIGNYAVKLITPGDSVSYTFDVTNTGTFDAAISSITIPTPTCTGSGTTATTDATNVCNHLQYKLTYSDGTTVATGDTLNSGVTKSMKLTLTYDNTVTASELAGDDVSISNLQIAIIYAQS